MIEDRFASAYQCDFARPPSLGEERFAWAVEAQEHEPAFAGHGLYPVE
jgi:hypothetical protein